MWSADAVQLSSVWVQINFAIYSRILTQDDSKNDEHGQHMWPKFSVSVVVYVCLGETEIRCFEWKFGT